MIPDHEAFRREVEWRVCGRVVRNFLLLILAAILVWLAWYTLQLDNIMIIRWHSASAEVVHVQRV